MQGRFNFRHHPPQVKCGSLRPVVKARKCLSFARPRLALSPGAGGAPQGFSSWGLLFVYKASGVQGIGAPNSALAAQGIQEIPGSSIPSSSLLPGASFLEARAFPWRSRGRSERSRDMRLCGLAVRASGRQHEVHPAETSFNVPTYSRETHPNTEVYVWQRSQELRPIPVQLPCPQPCMSRIPGGS